MNLRDLEYLVALAELRHFRKAAERCFVSQPTLSGQIKKLEAYLGVQLLERSKHRVMLTPIGEEIVRRAQRILQEAQNLEEVARASSDPSTGPIHIGLIPTVAPYLLPLILAPLKAAFPQLELMLHEVQTDVLVKQLRQGSLDVGILAVPLHEEGLNEELLYHEPFVLATPAGHALSQQKQVSLSALNKETLLLLEDGHCLRDQALELCFSAGAREQQSFRATSLETLKHLVAAGNGMTLLPQLAAQPVLQGASYLPFEAPAPARTIGLLYRATSNRSPFFKTFGACIRSQVEHYLPKGATHNLPVRK
jgi:LysR family hydrogen peroxide-inducible transcriptional activator